MSATLTSLRSRRNYRTANAALGRWRACCWAGRLPHAARAFLIRSKRPIVPATFKQRTHGNNANRRSRPSSATHYVRLHTRAGALPCGSQVLTKFYRKPLWLKTRFLKYLRSANSAIRHMHCTECPGSRRQTNFTWSTLLPNPPYRQESRQSNTARQAAEALFTPKQEHRAEKPKKSSIRKPRILAAMRPTTLDTTSTVVSPAQEARRAI